MADILVALDPGNTAGLAWWDLDPAPDPGRRTLLGLKQIPDEEIPAFMMDLAKQHTIKYLVVEDFVLFGKRAKQQSGSRMKASKGIGKFEMLAEMLKAKLIMQPSSILPIAIKRAGIDMPHAHSQTHQYSAYVHGYYYMLEQGWILSALQLDMRDGN